MMLFILAIFYLSNALNLYKFPIFIESFSNIPSVQT